MGGSSNPESGSFFGKAFGGVQAVASGALDAATKAAESAGVMVTNEAVERLAMTAGAVAMHLAEKGLSNTTEVSVSIDLPGISIGLSAPIGDLTNQINEDFKED